MGPFLGLFLGSRGALRKDFFCFFFGEGFFLLLGRVLVVPFLGFFFCPGGFLRKDFFFFFFWGFFWGGVFCCGSLFGLVLGPRGL